MNILKRLLAEIGFPYCRTCGSKLWFDDAKFDLGYRVHSVCLKCKGQNETII